MTTSTLKPPRCAVSVNGVHGSYGSHSQDDIDRAIGAAEAVLKSHRADARTAFAAYVSVCNGADRCQESDAWEAASRAADIAFTQGWHDPNAAFVDLLPL